MGYPKALLPLGEHTFLTRILHALDPIKLSEIRVILGAHAPSILPLLTDAHVRTITNPRPERGQLSSMQLGMTGLDPASRGCLIWPVDQPVISAGLVRALIEHFLKSTAQLAVPICGGKTGHPAIFGRALIEELLALPPDATPKPAVARHLAAAAFLPTDEQGSVEDIDSPEDYERLTGESLSSALSRIHP